MAVPVAISVVVVAAAAVMSGLAGADATASVRAVPVTPTSVQAGAGHAARGGVSAAAAVRAGVVTRTQQDAATPRSGAPMDAAATRTTGATPRHTKTRPHRVHSSTKTPSPTKTSTAPATQSCPAYPSFPNAACTGVPVGAALTVVTGDQSFGSSYNGKTISNKDFHGFVVVTGSNITFKNCWFRGRDSQGQNHALFDAESSPGLTTVMDSSFAPSNPAPTIDDLALRHTNLYRDDISGGVDGMKADSYTLVQDSYIHNMTYFSSDPNQGGGPTHNDGVQTFAGESHITLQHNTIDLSGTHDSNAAWQDSGTYARAQYNYLDGGGCTLNFAAQVLNGATLTPIYVDYNHFGRHQGFTGCVALISLKAVMTEYKGNVWQDTGAAVPAPQQHD